MCCIFTCCGWMIDLVQRLWTFAMSCCISSAVCCSLLTASMSGIALGYNYSLAEYIDLKETNVSIYLKRGVFDDEIADDMEWRRSGKMPVDGFIGDQNLVTVGAGDDASLRSGRRLDDSILESNDKNSFEGALMKLTAKPPADSVTVSISTPKLDVSQLMSELPMQPLNHLKAVQSAINMRKAAEAQRRQYETNKITPEPPPPESGRRMLPHFSYGMPPFDKPTTGNSLRNAVPPKFINEPINWMLAKKPEIVTVDRFDEYFELPSLPTPPREKPKPIRSTRLRPMTMQLTTRLSTFRDFLAIDRDTKEKPDAFNQNVPSDKDESPSDFERDKMRKGEKQEEDYEEDIKGIPLRKKRNVFIKRDSVNTDMVIYNHKDKDTKQKSLRKINEETFIVKVNEARSNTQAYIGSIQNSGNLLDTAFVRLIISTTIS